MTQAEVRQATGARWTPVLATAILAGAFFVLAWGGIYLTREAGRVSALWLPNALLVAAVLRTRDHHLLKVLACFAANVGANLASGDAPAMAAGLAMCNSFEVLAIVWCMRRVAPQQQSLTSLRALLAFSLIAGLIVPTITSTAATFVLRLAGSASDLAVWATYLKAHALGQVVAAPILLILADAWKARAGWTRRIGAEAGAILATVVLVCVGVFSQDHLPLLFIVIPFILVAAFRLGATGAACATIVVAVASGLGTALGTGPITLVNGGIGDKLTILQMFLATSFASALPVAAALEQRVRLSEALNRSELMLATITDNIRDVVFRADRQGRWSFLNPAWEQLTGRSVEDSIGTPVDALIIGEDMADAREQFAKLMAGACHEVQTQFRFQHAGGEVRWVEITVRPQRNGNGDVVGTIGSLRDITERQEQALALAARERELRLVTTHSVDMIVRTGMDRIRRYVSPASRTLLGFEPEEMINQAPYEGIHPDDVADVDASCVATINNGGSAHSIYRQRHKDGHYVWVEASYSVVPDEKTGAPLEFIASVRDFEARKRLEEELHDARDRAEDAARLKASFLANMSHEIRTPINGVIGFTELLLGSDLDDEQRRWANLIEESGRTMMALLNDILDLSKIDADQIEIVHEPFDLHHAIAGSVRLASPGARNDALAIDLLIDESVPRYALGDSQRLRQILLNLMSNAIKFTEAGHVRLGACAVDGRLEITVEDSGCGIAPERQQAVFEQFVQADSTISRRFGGTGLGLAISQRLARLMGGDLRLAKSDAAGTRMQLTLPLEPADADAVPAKRETRAVARPYAPAQRARILVAEDMEINQLLIEALLTRHGHQVTIVGNGADAVRAFTQAEDDGAPFDLILMDMQMPEVDGLEATRRLRALRGRGGAIPVIALTANAFASDADACIAAGMDAHLAKPIDAEALYSTISRLTRRLAPPEPAAPEEDPAVAALRSRYEALKLTYAAELKTLGKALGDAEVDADAAERIAGICHKLAGSAGMFGEADLGDLARAVESLAEAGAASSSLSTETQALAAALVRAA